MNFKIWLEQFNTAFDLLLNKDYSDKTFDEIMKEFEKSGGKYVGVGKFGSVFEHPNWRYVLKTFNDDNCYLKFARFAYANPHTSFPKFFGLPHKIIPQYKRIKSYSTIYYVRIEKLFPIDESLAKNIINSIHSISYHLNTDPKVIQQQRQLQQDYEKNQQLMQDIRTQNRIRRKNGQPLLNYPDTINGYNVDQHLLNSANLMEQHPELKALAEGWKILQQHDFQCALDLHSNSVMKRENGQLIWIDPLWYGSNPYMDALEAQRAETGYDGHEDEPEMIQGGKLPKKIKPKKVKNTINQYDDVPF